MHPLGPRLRGDDGDCARRGITPSEPAGGITTETQRHREVTEKDAYFSVPSSCPSW
ncbi:hypothetical protein MTBUT4_30098 [Magnetospirillum sp. UT-4]|nr:hypothetical protein MTBUT4_30098 [Magnetospirillum sp. UT-4]